MKITHGILLVDNKMKVLCVHPTNADKDFWSLPKGGAEEGETSLEAAIREMKEETNFTVDPFNGHIVYYEFLGGYNYKRTKKKLNCHVVYIDLPLSTMDLNLKCESLIDGTDIPECDIVKWRSIDSCLKILHHTQVEALSDCMKKLIKINQKKF